MTATQLLDGLSETLAQDERVLSLSERKLLSNILQQSNKHSECKENAIAETLARALGEAIAQRVCGVLGRSIANSLVEESVSADSLRLRNMETELNCPPPPGPPHNPSPGPVGPG